MCSADGKISVRISYLFCNEIMKCPRVLSLSILLLLQIHWISSSVPGLTSEQVAQLEMEQFEIERDDFIRELEAENHNARVKRTVMFNSEAPLDVVLLFAIPITVILPVLQNVFTNLNWSKIFKFKRSVDEDEIEYIEESRIVQPHLDKITGYFELMRVPEKSCQQRAICEFAADPDKYYPVSELVLNRIRNPSLPPLAYLENDQHFGELNHNLTMDSQQPSQRLKRSLFRVYTDAADKGLIFGQNVCLTNFSRKCPHSMDERLDMRALHFWKLLSTFLKFNIRDDVNSF